MFSELCRKTKARHGGASTRSAAANQRDWPYAGHVTFRPWAETDAKETPLTVDGERKVTITAIAREAGVSVPTVSRVVNGRSDVSPATRARIEELLHEHGYRRRTSRRRDRAGLIDLVFNDLDSPWAVEIIRGVEEVAHAAGVGTVVSATHRRSTSTRQWLENLRARASDAVILVASTLQPTHQAELR